MTNACAPPDKQAVCDLRPVQNRPGRFATAIAQEQRPMRRLNHGMIVTEGGRFGGYGLFLSKGEFDFDRGKVVFLYNLLDLKRTIWEGPELHSGKHTIKFDFKSDGPGLGKGGTGVLYVDGQEVARNSLDHTTPITFPEDETFDIGQDTRTPLALVEYRYDVPFKFTGKIDKLTFELDPGSSAAKP
jgi:hypothetical protein